jgi:hypothetical protein
VIGRSFDLASIYGRPQRQVIVSNQPSAFADYVSPTVVKLMTDSELPTLACDDKQPFVLLAYEQHPLTPAVAACLKKRPTTTIATLKLSTPSGQVPGVVLDVPGVFPHAPAS